MRPNNTKKPCPLKTAVLSVSEISKLGAVAPRRACPHFLWEGKRCVVLQHARQGAGAPLHPQTRGVPEGRTYTSPCDVCGQGSASTLRQGLRGPCTPHHVRGRPPPALRPPHGDLPAIG